MSVLERVDWREPYQQVEGCTFQAIHDTEMVARSRDSQIDDPETHVGQGDVWFRHTDRGFAGLWKPPNRNNHFRIAPIYVLPEHRGQGIAVALVMARFLYATEERDDITSLDTYAHNPALFEELGFTHQESYEFGTHYLTYEVES